MTGLREFLQTAKFGSVKMAEWTCSLRPSHAVRLGAFPHGLEGETQILASAICCREVMDSHRIPVPMSSTDWWRVRAGSIATWLPTALLPSFLPWWPAQRCASPRFSATVRTQSSSARPSIVIIIRFVAAHCVRKTPKLPCPPASFQATTRGGTESQRAAALSAVDLQERTAFAG